eukprot:TRINITY_DN94392_c0_g1_i1.p1 TRINITY_DN94392_c0_g1~~TRINITY_DN94392_c0_g1_i1.p1  ORF type:complete len:285 (+),score=46.73 TRINITY_DN94392_c0_g1_i1:64-918(+)
MESPPIGLPPAVARIFERSERVEPLLAHRGLAKHVGSRRLEPLLVRSPPPGFPADDLRNHGRSGDARGIEFSDRLSPRWDDSPGPSPRLAADDRVDNLFGLEPLPMSVRPRPPPGPKPKASRARMVYSSTELAENVYLAPVVPGLARPAKRRPHRPRKAESRAAVEVHPAPSPVGQAARPLPPSASSPAFVADTKKQVNPVQKNQRGTQEAKEKLIRQPKQQERKEQKPLSQGEKEAALASVCDDVIGAVLSDGFSCLVLAEEDDGLEIVESVDEDGFEIMEPV